MSKTILITGCSSGFGLVTAKYLQDKGYTVIPTVRKATDISDLPNSVQLDVTWEQKKINEAVNKIVDKYGQIDCLINNAGYGYQVLVENANEGAVRDQFETNFMGSFKMIKAVLPNMKKVQRGLIINVSSILGLITVPKYGIYAASKHALEAMSKSLRLELFKDKIKVVVINPGSFKTDFNKKSKYNNIAEATLTPYGGKPVEFATLIEKILLSAVPKSRYVLGREAVMVKIIQLLPEWLSEYIILRALT